MKYALIDLAGSRRVAFVDGTMLGVLPERYSGILDLMPDKQQPAGTADVEMHVPLSEARLLAPLRPHKNVFCVGRNYLAHAEETTRARGVALEMPDVPTFFSKAPTAIVDPEATMRLDSRVSTKFDWEAELGVVIGRRCRDVPEAEALDFVFGYCCVNDVSARDLQQAHVQWFKGKSLDDTCPLGPWIVAKDEIPDPQALSVELRVNGVIKQHGSTSQMIFSVARIIAELSRGMTLEPGDVIATGTPDGVGFARNPPEYLRDGDVVEVEIQDLGVLRNAVSLAPRGVACESASKAG